LISIAHVLAESGAFGTALTVCDLLQACSHRLEPYLIAAKVLLGQHRLDLASKRLRAAARLFPQRAVVHGELGYVLLRMKHRIAAAGAFRRSLELDPDQPSVLLQLGTLQLALRRLEDAELLLKRAISLEPRLHEAHYALGLLYWQKRCLKLAKSHCDAALGGSSIGFRVNALLSTLLLAANQEDQAREASLRAIAALPAVHRQRGRGSRPAVFVLCGLGTGLIQVDQEGRPSLSGGHNNLHELIDRTRFQVAEIWMQRAALANSQLAAITGDDVVLNVMSEPDGQASDLTLADRLLPRMTTKIVNRPAAVLNSARDKVARQAMRINGLVVPRSIRMQAGIRAVERGMRDFHFPLLLRPAGSHCGSDLYRADSPLDAKEYLTKHAGDDVYATAYIDTQWRDKLFRKFRVYWVGDHAVPEHYYIGESWNVHSHSWRMLMRTNRSMQDEAVRFLHGLDQHSATRVMHELAELIGLDVFMADFGLMEDGQLVLYEANATMSAILECELQDEGEYLTPFVRQIRNELNELLRKTAAG
jgi:tetratricopeptide (TPR) repeat protein